VSRMLAVAARELRERWLLFPGALASGCFPLVLPAFGVEREVMPVVGFVGAILLGLAAAAVIGSSMLARDAVNGRLGFLFSRPVSWLAIWGGKWLAAVVLVAGTTVLAMVPWMLVYTPDTAGGAHGDSWLRAIADSPGTAFFLVLLLLGPGIANFNATLFRSRSAWLVFDFTLLLVSIWATRRYIAPLWRYGVIELDAAESALTLLPLALALLVGSLAQVKVGRTDIRRAHRALSLAFWAIVAAGLAVAAGYWHWVRAAGLADVAVRAVTRDPAGRFVGLEGTARHRGFYPHAFLLDTTTGRYVVLPGPDDRFAADGRLFGPGASHGMLFSADGRKGALARFDGTGAAIDLYDLGGDTPRLERVALEASPPPDWGTAFALSPSAASVLMVHESGASLYALPSGRRVATTTIGPGWRPAALRFLSEDRARAWLVPRTDGLDARRRAEMRVVDLGTDGASSARTFATLGKLEHFAAWRGVVADAGGMRVLTPDAGVQLRDGATGALVATLAETRGAAAFFLEDGRVVVGDTGSRAEPGPPQATLRTFDRAGVPSGEIRLDLPRGGLGIGPEVSPGRVLSSSRLAFLPANTVLADVAEGRVVERLPGLQPATGYHWDASSRGAPAASRVQFFVDDEGRVLRVDFATGERKVVAGPGAPPGERVSAR